MATQSDNDTWFLLDDFSTTVVTEDGDGSILVDLAGEFDLSTLPDLRECLVSPEALDAGRVKVDLTRVTFLDSLSVELLASAGNAVRETGGTFSTRCGEGIALRVLEISGLVDFFELESLPVPPRGAMRFVTN